MIIDAVYPDKTFWEFYGFIYWYEGNTRRGTNDYTRLPKNVTEGINQAILSAFVRDSSIYAKNYNSSFFGNYLNSSSGVPVPPIDHSFDIPELVINNQPHYSASKRSGDIIVSPFRRGRVVITELPGYTATNIGGWANQTRDLVSTLLFEKSTKRPGFVIVNGTEVSGTVRTRRRREVRTEGGYPSDCGFSVQSHFDQILTNFVNLQPNFAQMVNTVADANEGVLDALTAIAEARETAVEGLKGCTTIVLMYRDAKAKEFRLRDNLSKRLPNLKVRERALAVKQLADAVSQVWLTYRLSIYPTVQTVDTILKDLFNGAYDFQRYRNTMTLQEQIVPHSTLSNVVFRTFIKRSYRVDKPVYRYGWNPISTAWELVPLSFIVDRYLNIGDFLSTLLNPKLYVKQGATNSWKIAEDILSDPYLCNNSRVKTSIAAYSRKPFDPDHVCGITLPLVRPSAQQHLDEIAIAWLKLTNGLDKVIRNRL